MKRLLSFVLITLTLALVAFAATPADIRFTNDGAVIAGGNLGEFTLQYPAFLAANHEAAGKLLDKQLAGKTATLKYDNGAEIALSAGADGKIGMRFSHMPASVEEFELNMLIPIAFNQGGGWKLDEQSGDFPKSKPAQPHLYQGHATVLELHNFEGKTLRLQAPKFAFLQLTDNREWNWPIFNWRANVPLGGRTEFTVAVTLEAGSGKARPLVDEFGQSTREEWPGKVKSLDDLMSDVEAEKVYYASLHPPETDAFGGRPGTGEKLGLKKTGFFHLEKSGDLSILVDPAGNAFFHLGLCGVAPSDDYTLVKGRESAFAWLPPPDGEFASAYKPGSDGSVISFLLANQIRKYHQPYEPAAYRARMFERMQKWGFNSLGAFTVEGPQAGPVTVPYVGHLPLNEWEGVPRLPSIGETFDPFDEKTRATAEANMAKALPARAKDPLLIGYFIVNEPIYENIPHMLPTLKGSYACKRRFVEWLTGKHRTVAAFNSAWKLQAASFDELNDTALPVETAEAKADVQAFTGVFLEEYFRFIESTFRRYDPTHLLLGCRLQPGTIKNEQLCRIAGQHIDVMSFNYYTDGVDKALLRRVYGWTGGRPMMLSEFFWGSSKQSGLTGGREVPTQRERGLAYRNYVEQSASLGFVVGIEWFTLVDQAVSGRWFQGFDGERANTGVIAVTDRPWKDLLEGMVPANYGVYDVWLNKKAPFVFDNPRFKNED